MHIRKRSDVIEFLTKVLQDTRDQEFCKKLVLWSEEAATKQSECGVASLAKNEEQRKDFLNFVANSDLYKDFVMQLEEIELKKMLDCSMFEFLLPYAAKAESFEEPYTKMEIIGLGKYDSDVSDIL